MTAKQAISELQANPLAPKKRFTAGTWRDENRRTHVTIYDNLVKEGTPVFKYTRNYDVFFKTFEPFRVWDEKTLTWRNFALISPQYVNFELVDLDEQKVVAKNAYPVINGKEMPAAGFCPVEFYVPDMTDFYEPEDVEESDMEAFLKNRTFGFMLGCIWGDDSLMKVRAVDLTEVLNENISSDERFGYLELPNSASLRDIDLEVLLTEDFPVFNIPVSITFRLDSNQHVRSSEIWSTIPGLVDFFNRE